MLRGLYPGLPEAEKRVARRVLEGPDEVLASSITELAREASVAVSTVTRLCSKLGYSGFPEMKIALAVEIFNPDYEAPGPVQEEDGAAAIASKVLRSGAQGLVDTVEMLDASELARAAEAVAGARRVEVYGSGHMTGSVARMAYSRLLVAGVPSALLLDPDLHDASASLLGEGDVAIGFSKSGARRPLVEVLATANASGATTVAVTGAPGSPLAREAGVALTAASREAWVWGHAAMSVLPMLGLVEALYACVLQIKYRQQAAGSEGRVPDGPVLRAVPEVPRDAGDGERDEGEPDDREGGQA
jgi:DNA-binding MurR/RpiR family transcriptional regulator